MKKLMILVVVVFGLTAFVAAQDPEIFSDPATRKSEGAKPIFTVGVIENGWFKSGGPFTDKMLRALVAKIIMEEWGWAAGKDLQKILDEANARDKLKEIAYVKQGSDRLKDSTIEVPEWHVSVISGGSDSASGISLGNYRLGGSSKSVTSDATIELILTNSVHQFDVKILEGKSTHTSTIVERIRVTLGARPSILGILLGNRFDYRAYSKDQGYRAGMFSTTGALTDLRNEIRKFVPDIKG